jgi:hypothetical protein
VGLKMMMALLLGVKVVQALLQTVEMVERKGWLRGPGLLLQPTTQAQEQLHKLQCGARKTNLPLLARLSAPSSAWVGGGGGKALQMQQGNMQQRWVGLDQQQLQGLRCRRSWCFQQQEQHHQGCQGCCLCLGQAWDSSSLGWGIYGPAFNHQQQVF